MATGLKAEQAASDAAISDSYDRLAARTMHEEMDDEDEIVEQDPEGEGENHIFQFEALPLAVESPSGGAGCFPCHSP